MADIDFFQGETPAWQLVALEETFTGATGTTGPLDLRAASVWFTAKQKIADTYSDAVLRLGNDNAALTGITVDPADPGNVATISLTAEQTRELAAPMKLVYDVKVDAGGTVTVIEEGIITVKRAITDP